MNTNKVLQSGKRIGTGLAFILFPLIFVFAFSVHPGLLTPHFLNPEELIYRAHQNDLLQFGHMLVTLCTSLLIVTALHFMRLLEKSAGWAGTIGGILAIFGAMMLAVDKGALCLTMSALDSISESQFAQMMPGLLAMFSKEGWLVIIWGIHFLAHRFCHSSDCIDKNPFTSTLAKYFIFDRGVVRGNSGWHGDHQFKRIHIDGNCPCSLWCKTHCRIKLQPILFRHPEVRFPKYRKDRQ